MKRIFTALIFSLLACTDASAQGCGSSNPNCIVPDVTPATTSNSQAANTKFVQGAISANSTHFAAGGISTGSANAQVIATVSPPVFSLTGNPTVSFTAGFSNSGATTLNVASSGVFNLLKKTPAGLVALVTGDVIANQQYLVTWDGTEYELQTPSQLASGAFGPLTGDVTTSGFAATIANNAVTNAKLATATQNTVKGAATSTAVTDLAVPSCSTATSALTWTTNVGLGCNSINSLPTMANNTKLGNVSGGSALPIANQIEYIHVKDFAAVGDNSTDDTTHLQNWLNACTAANIPCWLDPPSVCYKITAALTVTSANGVTIQGPGMDKVGGGICLSSTTQNGIVATTLGQINLYEFKITGQALATAGDLLQINSGTTTPNQYSKIRGMWFQGGISQAHFVSASGWTIYGGSLFASPNTAGVSVFVEDTTASDAGDQAIVGNTFTGSAVGTAIIQTSGGGLKVGHNKIINYANGYLLSLSAGVSTSDLFFSGNSMEAFTASGISLNKGSGTVFGTVNITGNEINGCGGSCFGTDATAGWLSNVIVSSNHLSPNNGGTCISLGTGTGMQVTDNNCQSGGGVTVGISVGANVTSGLVANNIFTNSISTLYAGAGSTGVRYVDHFGITFAALPANPGNGSVIFISDADPATSPCTHAGAQTGSTAMRQNAAWKCF